MVLTSYSVHVSSEFLSQWEISLQSIRSRASDRTIRVLRDNILTEGQDNDFQFMSDLSFGLERLSLLAVYFAVRVRF